MTVVTENIPENAETKKSPMGRIIVVLLLIAAGVAYGVHIYIRAQGYQSTENASLEAHIVQIAPRVAGQLTKVLVDENEHVKKGQLLVELDARDYELRVSLAEANLKSVQQKLDAQRERINLTRASSGATLEGAEAQREVVDAGIKQSQAAVDSAREQKEANRLRAVQAHSAIETSRRNVTQALAQAEAMQVEAARAHKDEIRYKNLYAQKAVARQVLDNATAQARTAQDNYEAAYSRARALNSAVKETQSAYQTALQGVDQGDAMIAEAQARVAASRAQVGDVESKIHAAQTGGTQVAISTAEAQTTAADLVNAKEMLRQARLNLSYCKIFAPSDGKIARKNAEPGGYVQLGQALMSIVSNDLWVVANFKETQLTKMRVGQKALIHVDVASKVELEGHVDSVQPGTGSRFSLLPPENASGNWVKVVQRVPVKILFDKAPDPNLLLAPGMSVTAEVELK